jgi:pyruvate/2-oxoglutarate dehydrogenase complex dihydrolipoamide acyltransferase (E2) component
MTDIVIPNWGLTMDDAVFLGWHKEVGDPVREGEAIAEVETDKTTAELESPATGVLAETFAAADDEVRPGQVVGRIAPA